MRGHIFVSLLLPLCAVAQEARLEDLIAEALERNPEILAAQKRVEAARLRPSQAASLRETMFSAGYASNGRPWPGAGLGVEPTSNLGLMVTQEFPAPGKRRLRGAVAEREAEAEMQQYQAAKLGVLARLKLAWYRAGYTNLAEEVIVQQRDLLRKLARIAEVRYSVGKAPQQDVLRAQTQVSIFEARLIQIERERAARRAELLSLVNRRPEEPLGGISIGRPPEIVHKLEELFAMANAGAPALARDQKMIARNQVALNLARKDFYPDYAISGGYFNMGRMPDMFQARVDFRLPTSWFRKQRPAVAEQASLLAESQRQMEATARSIAFRIQDDYLAASTSARLMKLYEQTVVPQGSLTLESSLASYETGAVDLGTVLSNFLIVTEYQMNYYDELLNVWLALVRLEEATGAQLTGERP